MLVLWKDKMLSRTFVGVKSLPYVYRIFKFIRTTLFLDYHYQKSPFSYLLSCKLQLLYTVPFRSNGDIFLTESLKKK